MFGVSVIVGVLCTVFIWPLVRSKLAAARERNEELIRNADPETRSALEFNQPPLRCFQTHLVLVSLQAACRVHCEPA